MQTETVTHDTITATVRTRYVRTALIEARYFQMLREAYPEIKEAERVIASIPLPSNIRVDEQLESYGQKIAMSIVGAGVAVGQQYMDIAQPFVKLAARLHNLSGAPYALGAKAQFEAAELVKAFESRLDEEDVDGFWGKVAAAITALDAPLTPVDQQPKEALTAAQRNDPLLPGGTANGTTA